MDTRASVGLRNGPPFCTLDGDPLYAQYVRQMLRRMADRAGIEKRVHPHGLRHTFAKELRQAGVDVVTISKLLGHSSIAVTSRYLDHLTNDQASQDAGCRRPAAIGGIMTDHERVPCPACRGRGRIPVEEAARIAGVSIEEARQAAREAEKQAEADLERRVADAAASLGSLEGT